jgi:hypothetical protein
MSSERAGVHTGGTLNREEALELLSDLLEVAGGTIATSRLHRVLDALEACVVPDPRITRIEALLEQYSAGIDIDDWVPLAQVRAALR